MANTPTLDDLKRLLDQQKSEFESTVPSVVLVHGIIRRDMDLFRDGKFLTSEYLKQTLHLLKKAMEENK